MGYVLKQGNKGLYNEVFKSFGEHVLFVCPYCGSKWALEKYSCRQTKNAFLKNIYHDTCPTCNNLCTHVDKPWRELSFEEVMELNNNGITLDG